MITHRLFFDDAFADLITSGTKCCTIRRMQGDMPTTGDRLQLCTEHQTLIWQFLRDDAVCTAVRPIRIYRPRQAWTTVEIGGDPLILAQIRILALADGFAHVMDFLRYFERKGLPFEGVLIEWAQLGQTRKGEHHRSTLCPLVGCLNDCQYCPHIHDKMPARQENPHTPPPVRECCTCKHEGNSIEDWPCRTSMNAAGLTCWEPKEVHNGTART